MTADSTPRRKLSGISAVFPAMNDGGTIASMVLTARAALRAASDRYEIIVVDNGSRDYTGLVLKELAGVLPELHVIHSERQLGYGGALRAGFAAAREEWIFYTDGDGQYNPLELAGLVDAAGDGVDVVNGYKLSRQDPWYRVVLGRAYHHTVRLFFGFHLRDVDCDFRLFRRSILTRIPLESDTGAIGLELVKRFQDAGFVFREVPVHHYYRRYGVSQVFHLRRLILAGRNLIRLWHSLKGKPHPPPSCRRYSGSAPLHHTRRAGEEHEKEQADQFRKAR